MCKTVFLYINNNKCGKYKYWLPYGLSDKMTIKAIILTLGEPTSKSKYQIECEWDHLGLGVVFKGKNWAD